MRQMKKPLMLLLLIAMFSMALSGAVYAQGKKDNGPKLDRYHPHSILNVETAVSLIVQRLHLNIDNMRFIKAPLASDYYTKINDKAWYANNFVIAQFNGIVLPKDIDPNAKVTKEQFASWLNGAMSNKGEYPMIEIFLLIADEDQVSEGMMNSIQRLLISKIATLDKNQKFYPKNGMKRGDALVMIERTINFIKKMENTPAPVPESPIFSDVQVTSEKHSEQVTQVTLTATAPHPGYGFEVSSIIYENGEARINYRITLPNPDMMYAQVITEMKAVTYIASEYKPVLGISETIYFPVE